MNLPCLLAEGTQLKRLALCLVYIGIHCEGIQSKAKLSVQ